jgi:transglutaminase/protease-like cytokinesis protein 3
VNHYWNAVYFDDDWHLLDATWASGYVARNGGMFIRDYDPTYFLTAPEKFIKDHYPDDIAWTLLPESKVPDEFRYSPFKQASFTKYQITSYSPSKGIIDVFVGDTISLEIRSSLAEDRAISPSLVRSPDSISYSESIVFLRPDKTEMGLLMPKHCQYTFAVASDKIQWLYLIYNDDLVLRYRVNVKNKKS